jgi:hypothetical protein
MRLVFPDFAPPELSVKSTSLESGWTQVSRLEMTSDNGRQLVRRAPRHVKCLGDATLLQHRPATSSARHEGGLPLGRAGPPLRLGSATLLFSALSGEEPS